jgi:hypothetical protein
LLWLSCLIGRSRSRTPGYEGYEGYERANPARTCAQNWQMGVSQRVRSPVFPRGPVQPVPGLSARGIERIMVGRFSV